MRTDVYQKITDQIVTALEQGVTPWQQPWQVEHGTGRITRPLRANGAPYQGINVLMLWSAAIEKGYAAPIWMTYRQARELNAHVRKASGAASSFMPTRSSAPRRTPGAARTASAPFPS